MRDWYVRFVYMEKEGECVCVCVWRVGQGQGQGGHILEYAKAGVPHALDQRTSIDVRRLASPAMSPDARHRSRADITAFVSIIRQGQERGGGGSRVEGEGRRTHNAHGMGSRNKTHLPVAAPHDITQVA